MRLFIAEKPSVAKALAEHLGNPRRGDGCLDCGSNVVTWCFGHILEQAPPEAYGEQFKRWEFDSLPIVPEAWKLTPKEDAAKQLAAIGQLLDRADEIVHAGDPDREGQLLVDEVLEHFANRKPVRRIWLAALDAGSITKAMAGLRPNSEFQGLKAAAEARSRADWLVGMNLTRAYTIVGRKSGHDGVLSVGRVQTPTLALVVKRDLEIEGFKAKTYFSPVATVAHANGSFAATWQAPEGAAGLDDEGRLTDGAAAKALLAKLQGQPATIAACETKRCQEKAPLPWSLSAIQKAASAKYGMGAQAVLDACQSLYETHKLASYPRTDCPYLPQSQHGNAARILAALPQEYRELAAGADTSLKSPAYDDAKITAHHGIVPTGESTAGKSLTQDEARIFDLIVRAFIAQFYPAHEYDQTSVKVTIARETFTAAGRVEIAPGWRQVFTLDEENEGDESSEAPKLPSMRAGDPVRIEGLRLDEKRTKAPARFTDGSLIAAMTTVHKLVDDPKLKAMLKETAGIGTEATRAGIIETLLARGFIVKKGKQLISTPSGRSLIAALPPLVCDPGLTGLFEQALEDIVSGSVSAEAFLTRQVALVTKLVNEASNSTVNISGEVHKCPECSKPLRRIKGGKGFFWGCSGKNDGCKFTCDDTSGKPDFKGKKSGPKAKGKGWSPQKSA